MKKYRKHYYVKGMNTKYLTPLVCSPRMVQAPHSTSSQEPVLPGAMKEWRKDRDTENLGSVGHDSLVKTPQSPRLNIIYIIYNWAGRQSYCTQLAEEAGLSNLCRNSQQSSEGQKNHGGYCLHTLSTFTLRPALPSLGASLGESFDTPMDLASLAWPCPCQQQTLGTSLDPFS